MEEIKPYRSDEDKKVQVERMFDKISHRYDFLNRILSLGIDQYWRDKLLSEIKNPEDVNLLDVATGTADIAIMAAEKYNISPVIGLDISSEMLVKGRAKISKKGLSDKVGLLQGDSENLPYEDNCFDVVTSGFGVRNFGNLEKGLSEMFRVLKPGGQCLILEFSQPRVFPIAQIYQFYFKNVLPLIGRLTSSDNKAYTYLYESSMAFPSFEEFVEVLDNIGYTDTDFNSLTTGICCIYTAQK